MALEAKNITFGYGKNSVLNDFSLKLEVSDFIMLLGANGSGKSTAVKLLGGYLRPQAGSILLDGKELNSYRSFERAKKIAAVAQIPPPMLDFTVEEMVVMGRLGSSPRFGFGCRKDDDIILEVMEQMQISHLAECRVGKLSGGERQRVMLAQALAGRPQYLLLDEPTSALDAEHVFSFMQILRKINGSIGILMVCHDLNLAWNYAKKAVILKDNKISCAGEAKSILTPENIKENFNCSAIVSEDNGIILKP